MRHIVIVGAGIVGISIARDALKRGHQVTILEQSSVPNPHSASFDSHRMIRYHYGAFSGYTRMVTPAFDAWERVWSDLGNAHFENTGAVAISLEANDYGEKTLKTFREVGLQHEVHDRAAMESLFPHLDLPAHAWGVTGGRGGPLFAGRIVTELTQWVLDHGALIRAHCKVDAVDLERGVATLADGSTVTGDLLVVAAGAWISRLLPERFGNSQTFRQGLCYVDPPASYVQSWRQSPAIVAIGDHGGYTLPDRRGAGLKFGHGGHRKLAKPEELGFGSDLAVESAVILGAFKPYLKEPEGYHPIRIQVGFYEMDSSRRFNLETHSRGIVVTNCDGQMFKFGPLLGERIMGMFAGQQSATDLKRWAAGY